MQGLLFLMMGSLGCSESPNKDSGEEGVTSPGSSTLEPATRSACDDSGAAGSSALVFDGARPRNLLVISIDTLRVGDLGRYTGLDVSPVLDGILDDAVVADDMRSCANWTLPGVTCAMTGRNALEMGLEPMYSDILNDPDYLPRDLETLATWMKRAGYNAGLVTSSKLFSHDKPLGNDFDDERFLSDGGALWVVDEGLDLLSGYQTAVKDVGVPWYLHLHFRDPHAPYNPPEAYQGDLAGADIGTYDPRTEEGMQEIHGGWQGLSSADLDTLREHIKTLYRGEITYMDAQIARLWSELDSRGALDDTLVVFWSDHGEQFFEHDAFEHGESLHVRETGALGAFWSRNLAANAWSGPALLEDIPATVLEAMGIAAPTGEAEMSGVVLGVAPETRARVSASTDGRNVPIHMVDRSGHRLLYSWTGEKAYYRLDVDPTEAQNRYDSSDENVVCLWDILTPSLALVDAERAEREPADAGP